MQKVGLFTCHLGSNNAIDAVIACIGGEKSLLRFRAKIVQLSIRDFEANLNVKNPNAHPVIMDSIQFDAFLDDQYIMKGANGNRLNIAANSSGVAPIILNIPTDVNLKKVIEAEKIRMKGKVWLKIELIKGLPITLPFNFDVKQNVPRDDLQALIDKQKKKMMERMVKELAGDKVKKLLNKF